MRKTLPKISNQHKANKALLQQEKSFPVDCKVIFFSLQKSSWSKPVYNEQTIFHLTTGDEKSLCGIEKRFPDIYNSGLGAVDVEKQKIHICKLCYRSYKKKKYNAVAF